MPLLAAAPLLPLLAALAASLAPPCGSQSRRGVPDDERVREAWSYLLPEEQAEAMAWFSAEAAAIDSYQNQLLRHALSLLKVDPGFLAEDQPYAFFDPKKHAPGQPIARVRLEPDDKLAQRTTGVILAIVPERPLRSRWRYDWGRREILRQGPADEPRHLFENGLAGFPPKLDLAEAVLSSRLDRGEERLTLAAFEHAYTDREGHVFPGLSLYDAWASGTVIEMPDVDNLGIFHSVIGERGRFVAPIPEAQHDELYGIVKDLYEQGQRYRALRTALVQCYFVGTGPLRDGYEFHWLRLHGLWEEYRSSPEELAPVLPDSAQAVDFMADWALRFESDEQRTTRARARVTKLDANKRLVRGTLIGILEQMGAFERERLPKPKPKPKPAKKTRAGR